MPNTWGLVEPEEWEYLYKMARKRGPDGDVLNIGCGDGHGSVEALLDGMEYHSLVCVDNWENRDIRSAFHAFIDNHPYKDVKVFDMGSDEFFRTISPDWTFKFVFVDGNHDYPQALRDFTNSFRHLIAGGVLAGHDFQLESVQRAGNEAGIRENGPHSIRYRVK